MATSAQHADSRPLRLLSLDGGGVRGLSMLVALQRIMHSLQEKLSLPMTPKPCDYFDLIGGTSTGGVIALMLGPLRMSVDDAIDEFKTLSRKVFRDKSNILTRTIHSGQGKPFFDHHEFEILIQELVRKRCGEVDSSLRTMCIDGVPIAKHQPAVFVTAVRVETTQATLLRSYVGVGFVSEPPYRCLLWEAARATTAAPLFFSPITLRNSGASFVDGALRIPNPVSNVMREAQCHLWPGREIGCLISLGTGTNDRRGLHPGSNRVDQVIKACLTCAFDAHARHEDFVNGEGKWLFDNGRYVRLNPHGSLGQIVLDEAEHLATINALTDKYLQAPEVEGMLTRCVNLLLGARHSMNISTRAGTITPLPPHPTSHIRVDSMDAQDYDPQVAYGYRNATVVDKPLSNTVDHTAGSQTSHLISSNLIGTAHQSKVFLVDTEIPSIARLALSADVQSTLPRFSTDGFVGRERELSQIFEMLKARHQAGEDQRVALWGLGGVGKSQIVLRYAQQQADRSTFWITADTLDNVEVGYRTIADRLITEPRISQHRHDLFKAVRNVLEDERVKPWVLILDGADDEKIFDDPSRPGDVTLKNYIPRCRHGRVIFTTRNRGLIGLADGQVLTTSSEIKVSPMPDRDSAALFHSKLREGDIAGSSEEEVIEFVRMLGCLPLAVVQAASYIRRHHTPLADYRKLYGEIQKNWTRLFAEGAWTPDDQKTILTTWEISYQAVSRWPSTSDQLPVEKSTAASLLDILAFLDAKMTEYRHMSEPELALHESTGDGRDREWLREGLGPLVTPKQVAIDVLERHQTYHAADVSTQDEVDVSIGVLEDFALVAQRECWIHPVVHDWSYRRLESQKQHTYLCSIVSHLWQSLGDHEWWRPHASLQASWWGLLNPLHHAKFERYRDLWIVRHGRRAVELAMSESMVLYRQTAQMTIPNLGLLMYRMGEESYYTERLEDAHRFLSWSIAQLDLEGTDKETAFLAQLLKLKACKPRDSASAQNKASELLAEAGLALTQPPESNDGQLVAHVELQGVYQLIRLWHAQCLFESGSDDDGFLVIDELISSTTLNDLEPSYETKVAVIARLLAATYLVKSDLADDRQQGWTHLGDLLSFTDRSLLSREADSETDELHKLLPVLVYQLRLQAAGDDEERLETCRQLVAYERKHDVWRRFRLFGGSPGDWFHFLDDLKAQQKWPEIVAFGRIYTGYRHTNSIIRKEREVILSPGGRKKCGQPITADQIKDVILDWIDLHRRFGGAAAELNLFPDAEEQYKHAFSMIRELLPENHSPLLFQEVLREWTTSLIIIADGDPTMQGVLEEVRLQFKQYLG